MTATKTEEQLPRKPRRVHRRVDRADAAGVVIPIPEIVNRRTGYVAKHFGPRPSVQWLVCPQRARGVRLLDRGYRESALGFAPLAEHSCGNWTVDDLLRVLPLFCEQMTEEQSNQLRNAGPGASAQVVNGEVTITPGKGHDDRG